MTKTKLWSIHQSSLLLVLLFFTSMLQAQTADALYNKMNSVYGKLSSFQAEVTQENYFAQIKKSIRYNGRIYFSNGRMLMHFDKPNVQRLLISNGSADLYDAQSKTVFRSAIRPEFGKLNPLEILSDYWSKSTVQILSTKGSVSRVQLKPNNDPLISTLTATINNKTGIVSILAYTDANGNKVSYAFSGIKTNSRIPNSVWQYSYPKDVQVIKQ